MRENTCVCAQSAMPDITCKTRTSGLGITKQQFGTPCNKLDLVWFFGNTGRVWEAHTLSQVRLSGYKRRMPVLAKRRLAMLANLGRSFRIPVLSCTRCRRRSSLSALRTHIDADKNVNVDTNIDVDTGTSVRTIQCAENVNAHLN